MVLEIATKAAATRGVMATHAFPYERKHVKSAIVTRVRNERTEWPRLSNKCIFPISQKEKNPIPANETAIVH
jgi:hypothetical protein